MDKNKSRDNLLILLIFLVLVLGAYYFVPNLSSIVGKATLFSGPTDYGYGYGHGISVHLEINKEYLETESRGFINIDKYDEEITIDSKTYGIATSKDKFLCTAVLDYEDMPSGLHLWFWFYKNGKRLDPAVSNPNCKSAGGKTICTVGSIHTFKEGDIVKCGVLPFVLKNGNAYPGEIPLSDNEFVIATYVYYFVPINTNYGTIEVQYEYYTGLSAVNDRIDLVGKKILLNKYEVSMDRIEVLQGIGINPFNEIDSRAKRDIKSKLGKVFVPGSVITTVLPSKDIGVFCNGIGASCTNLGDDAVVVVSDKGMEFFLAHEFGHRVPTGFNRKARDSASLEVWNKQNKKSPYSSESVLVTPVGEAGDETLEREVRFPKCCMNKPTGSKKLNKAGKCGNVEICLGMPYLDKKGERPADIDVPGQIRYISIMGHALFVGTYMSDQVEFVYPKNAGCPLRDC